LILSITGAVRVLLVKVFVDDIVGTTTPSTEITPAEDLAIVVSVACPNSIVPTPSAVEVEAVMPLTGRPVQFVNVPEDGVPRTGAVSVGLVRVLFVNVSVVARPTKVSVEVGRVKVPVLVIVEITGEVRVLLVNVSEPARVARVPVVGRVTLVFALVVKPNV
jgi:hypothetical protein